MKVASHKIITRQAVDLLPQTARAFFAQPIDNETFLDQVVLGSKDEDATCEPFGIPESHQQGVLSYGDISQDVVSQIQNGKIVWMEHFWNRDFGEYGLTNPFMSNMKFYSGPHKADKYWDQYVINNWNAGNHKQAMYYLGRVVHLLEDTGTPSHVNNDAHPGFLDCGFDDDYEKYIQTIQNEETQRWKTVGSTYKIYYSPDWSLRDFFYNFGQISSLYDSDDVDGRGTGKPYRWTDSASDMELNRDVTGDLTDYACQCIGNDLIPLNYGFVAGLYLKFFHDISYPLPQMYSVKITLNRIDVHDDEDTFGPGEINIQASTGGQNMGHLGSYSISSGNSKTLSHEYTSFLVGDDRNIDVYFEVYDNDKWLLSSYAKDSMGSVSVIETPQVWQNWIGMHKEYEVATSNGDATLHFEIKVSSIGGSAPTLDDTQEAEQTNYDRQITPYCVINKHTNKVHKSTCGIVSSIKPENMIVSYMFPEEITKENLQILKQHKTCLADFNFTLPITRCGLCLD